jgi:hypothetical protein
MRQLKLVNMGGLQENRPYQKSIKKNKYILHLPQNSLISTELLPASRKNRRKQAS